MEMKGWGEWNDRATALNADETSKGGKGRRCVSVQTDIYDCTDRTAGPWAFPLAGCRMVTMLPLHD